MADICCFYQCCSYVQLKDAFYFSEKLNLLLSALGHKRDHKPVELAGGTLQSRRRRENILETFLKQFFWKNEIGKIISTPSQKNSYDEMNSWINILQCFCWCACDGLRQCFWEESYSSIAKISMLWTPNFEALPLCISQTAEYSVIATGSHKTFKSFKNSFRSLSRTVTGDRRRMTGYHNVEKEIVKTLTI